MPLADKCHLHIPHKDWAKELDDALSIKERENYSAIERWADTVVRGECGGDSCAEGFKFQFEPTTVAAGGLATPMGYYTFGTYGRHGFLNQSPAQWKSGGVTQAAIPVFGHPGILIPAGVWALSINMGVSYDPTPPTTGSMYGFQWTYNGPMGPPGGAEGLTYLDIVEANISFSVAMTGQYYDNPTYITAGAINNTDVPLEVSGHIEGIRHSPCTPTIDEG